MKKYLLYLLFVFIVLLSACGQNNKLSLNTQNNTGTNNNIEELKTRLEKLKLENEDLKRKEQLKKENKKSKNKLTEKKIDKKDSKEYNQKKVVDSIDDITYWKECFEKLSFDYWEKYTEKTLWEKSEFLEKCLDKTVPCPIYKKVDDLWTEKNIPSYKSYLFNAYDGTISTPTNDNFSRWLLFVKKSMFKCMKYSGQVKVDDKAK